MAASPWPTEQAGHLRANVPPHGERDLDSIGVAVYGYRLWRSDPDRLPVSGA